MAAVVVTPNLSTLASPAVAVPDTADTTAPSAPAAFTSSSSTSDSISIGWLASTDGVGVVSYEIWRNGTRLQATPANQTTFQDNGLTPGTNYTYAVRAVDAAGNFSAFGADLNVRTQIITSSVDTTPPSTPTAPAASQVAATSLTVSWGASTDNTGVTRYEVYRNGTILIGSTAQPFFTLTGLTASTTYTLTIKAFDAAGNASGTSASVVVSTASAPATPTSDTTPPTEPTGLATSTATSTSLSISWTASTDNVGVAAYNVYRDGIQVGATSATNFTLTGLNAATSYAMTVRAIDAAGNVSVASAVLNASPTPLNTTDGTLYNGKTYWVSKSGSDAKSCLSETTDACASIQKALSLAAPGDRIYIKPGTYVESSQSSVYTTPCSWFNGVASLCIQSSGTSLHPILVSAAPGAAKGSVVLDNANARVGIMMRAHDYITFRGLTIKNSLKNAIANGGQAENAVADPALLSIGVIIEDCQLSGVTTLDAGDNIATVGMWSTQDWIVRNNLLEGVPTGSGIRSYGVINALIEHNTIRNVSSGVMWKDHFVKDLATRQHVVESEIRYNTITAKDYGVLIQIRGTQSPEAGHNYVHHNIINGIVNGEPAGLRFAMSEAFAQSASLRFDNNLVDCSTAATPVGITIDSSNNAQYSGNIFINCGLSIEAIKYGNTIYANLTKSNHNVFVGSFSAVMDRYSPTSVQYPTLAAWQAATDAGSFSLGFNGPDAASKFVAYSSSLFSNTKPYFPSASSPAKGLLPDGSNAGPYQLGTETMGAWDGP